jgi:opacity protein-like surface antigen
MENTMKRMLSLLALLTVAAFASAPVHAASHYVSGMGGVSRMNNMTPEDAYQGVGGNNSSNLDLGSGVNVLGAIGCDYGNYRLEAEVGYQQNKLKSGVDYMDGVVQYHPLEGSRYDMRGDVSALSLMGNGYYDFNLGGGIDLYATAGVGVAQVSFHDVNFSNNYDATNNVLFNNPNPGYNDHETTIAYQVGAGLAFPVTDRIKLDLRYRYFATTDFTYSNNSFDASSSSSTPAASGINNNIVSHSALLGLRVEF